MSSLSTRSAMAPTWRWERPDVTNMVSAIEVLPTRSISTVFSAFMSSRQARATARISSSSGASAPERGGSEVRFASSGESRFRFRPFLPARERALFLQDSAEWHDISTVPLRRSSSHAPKLGRRRHGAGPMEEGPGRRRSIGRARAPLAPRSAPPRQRGGGPRVRRLQGPAGPIDDGDRHHAGRFRASPASGGSLPDCPPP